MWWYDDLFLIFLNPTMVMCWYALWHVCNYWLLLLSNFLVWSWGVCLWDTWLNHFWVSINIILGYFMVAPWEPRDIVIYLWCFLVAHRELMWLLWLSLWCFPITCVYDWGDFIWFFDLWFHELRVGYLYVVSRSGLL